MPACLRSIGTTLALASFLACLEASPAGAYHGTPNPDWGAHLVLNTAGTQLTPAAQDWIRNYSAAEDNLWRSQGAGMAIGDGNTFKRGLFKRLLPPAYPVLPFAGAQNNVREVCASYFPNGCWRVSRDDRDFDGGSWPQHLDDVNYPSMIEVPSERWSAGFHYGGLWEYNGVESLYKELNTLWGLPINTDHHCGPQGAPEWGDRLMAYELETPRCWHPSPWPGHYDTHTAKRSVSIKHLIEDVGFGPDNAALPNTAAPHDRAPWFDNWATSVAAYLRELPDPQERRIIQWIASRLGPMDSPYLAARFRPVLRFDTDEKWRPLDIDTFFAEGAHQLCAPGLGCQYVSSADALQGAATPDAYLDINGHAEGDPSIYRTNFVCTQPPLQDCDSANSKLYYRIGPPTSSGYRLIVYWAFYRFNEYEVLDLDAGNHEGDWEGVEVAPSNTDPETFDYISFSGHGTWYSYLRQNLECDDGPGDADCIDNGNKVGKRVRVYVANGSHANYPQPCSGGCGRGGPDPATGQPLPEKDYDGVKDWGMNYIYGGSGLAEAPQSWFNWPGRWGAAGSPRSPGLQPPSGTNSECALFNPNCPVRPARAARPLPPRVAQAKRGRQTARCGSWFGPHVVAVLCTPKLRSAVRTRTLGRRGQISIRVLRGATTSAQRRRYRASQASVRALAQALGRPVSPDDRLRVRGHLPAGSVLMVRGIRANRLVIDRFVLPRKARTLRARLSRSSGRQRFVYSLE